MPPSSSFNAAKAKSTSTFLSAFVISASVSGVQLLAFLLLRTSIKKIYSPRTFLPVPSKRSQPVSSAPWGWLLPTIRAPSVKMIPTAGLDAFMYLRFLKMMIYIFAPATCLTFTVLLPLDAVGSSVGSAGLNSFSFGNIATDQQIRYVGHLLCAYALTFWVIFLIQKEMSNYIYLRQNYLTSQHHIDLPQSRTVLVTGVPKQYLSVTALKKLTASLPGGIRRIWIARELKRLPELYNDRLKFTSMLESAETKLCKAAIKHHQRQLKQLEHSTQSQPSLIPTTTLTSNRSSDIDPHSENPVNKLVNRKHRPTHRLGFIGCFGKKVDTVDWCKDEIVRLTKEIEEERKRLDKHPPHNSAFIEFNDRLAAQIFSQVVLHQQPLRMAKRYVDAAPEDIIWDNLNINPYDERVRNAISWVLTVGLVILWSFPVAFIGSLSNITSLCTTVTWLSWLCRTSTHLQSVIQGILPPVLLALIFLILPMILRLIGRYSGVPRISEIELILMTRYYIFLVIHGFVVTTLSSGLTAAIPAISKDPSQAVTILTQNLPRASIFFMTYMVTTSLTSASGALLQVFDLILYYLKLFVFASTPRSVFDIRYTMSRPQFGTLFPNTTLLATIGLAYSIIAPVMTVLSLLAFSVYWLAYKYLFLFTYDIPAGHETGGRFFPLAMNHVFIGLYVSQICLTGLFFLARNVDDDPSSIPQGVLMIILIVFTFFCHVLIRNSYAPLTMFVPLSMIDDSSSAEEERLLGGGATYGDHHHRIASSDDQHSNESPHLKHQASHLFQSTVPSSPLTHTEIKEVDEDHHHGHQDLMGGETNETKKASDPNLAVPIRPTLHNSRQSSSGRAEEYYVEQGRTAFLHPAVWEKTRPIWIPEDPMGVSRLEMADMRRRNIPVSTEGAGMSGSGKVYVTRSPPETTEVIEIQRDKVEGIFALPGAIGEAARFAGGKIGEAVLHSATIGKSASQALILGTGVGGHARKESSGTTASGGGGGGGGGGSEGPNGRTRTSSVPGGTAVGTGSMRTRSSSFGPKSRAPLVGTIKQKFRKPSSEQNRSQGLDYRFSSGIGRRSDEQGLTTMMMNTRRGDEIETDQASMSVEESHHAHEETSMTMAELERRPSFKRFHLPTASSPEINPMGGFELEDRLPEIVEDERVTMSGGGGINLNDYVGPSEDLTPRIEELGLVRSDGSYVTCRQDSTQ